MSGLKSWLITLAGLGLLASPAQAQMADDPDMALDCAIALYTDEMERAALLDEAADEDFLLLALTYFAGRHDSLSSESFGQGLSWRLGEVSDLSHLLPTCQDELSQFAEALGAASEAMAKLEARI